jgi:hypothetical protein
MDGRNAEKHIHKARKIQFFGTSPNGRHSRTSYPASRISFGKAPSINFLVGHQLRADRLDIHPSLLLIPCLLFVVMRAADALTNVIVLELGDVVVTSIVSVGIGLI